VGEALELLDGTQQGVAAWGQQLPLRLQQMHSHWYCRSAHAVVLRRRTFDSREAQFLLLQSDTLKMTTPNFAGDAGWLCFRVPNHQARLGWLQLFSLLSTFDQLVLPAASQAMRVLSKFETQPGCVHAYRAAESGALIFELPRYDLGFELEASGRLRSRNFRGFCLAATQQLHDALGDYRQYLLLEEEKEEVLESSRQSLLVAPAGQVRRDAARVYIDGPRGCDSE
jgi:hypothetical protein